ncbi:unnamed protein product [Arctia plantaginis]|uniref:GYF domain-containing protein n=1 Tax=Arctia plantaginis TaxID=874455 RepID=A0A8S1BKN9_ARCPL|nr:unnamed protein product [Arctia plantaginis]
MQHNVLTNYSLFLYAGNSHLSCSCLQATSISSIFTSSAITMGDRNNPIKFGPEWLRNMPRERSAARSTSNSQNTTSGQGTAISTGSSGATGGATATTAGSTTATTNSPGTSKVLLAKLRYGREEMLALYDRNAEAPPELKVIDTLYQPRGKQPVALNNTFEDEVRDNLRGAPPIGSMSSSDRFGLGRGAGRGVISDGRGRPRGSYIRSPLTGRGAHYVPKVGGPRMPYSGGAEDDAGSIRPWSNNTLNNSSRSSGEQTDWATKMFRNKRQGTNTNWRQPQTRDDGDEWRSSESGRSRQLEKWERDWGDRPSGEKSQSWNTNRRTWVGGDTQNEENLPEWAGENAECGGTFDSSGAFHGYSNDDTNLPKHQDSSYPLTRSHTHGSFPRPKALEEGSDEWWASEKAKKLSPKRFDANDIKFKKQSSLVMGDGGISSISTNKSNTNKDETALEAHETRETTAAPSEPPEANAAVQGDEKYSNQNLFKSKFAESKTFDALMRSDINVEEASDERGNFQSVIIAANNSLRQKHQHMVMAADGQKHVRNALKGNNKSEIDHGAHKSPEDMLVDNIFGMTIDDDELLSTSLSKSGLSSEITAGTAGLSQNQHQNIQMSLSNSALPNLSGRTMDMHLNKQNMQSSGMQSGHPMSNMQPSVMQKVSGMQMPSGGHMQNPGMQSSGMQTSGLSNPVMASVGIQNPGLPPGGMQNSGLQSSGMQAPRVQTPGMPSVMQPVGITNSALNASLGLPIVPSGNMGLPLQGVPQQVMPNVCMANNMASSGMGVMGSPSMQGPGNMAGYQSNSGLSGPNVGNSSLFLGQNSNNPSMSSTNEQSRSNHGGQSNMFPLHGLQHSGSQASFGNSMYSNNQNLAEQWYYEDPERNIQGPFSSKDMYNWYRAGFFSPSLMVRRACETMMRPLGSYGPVVPFVQMDMMPGFPMSGGYESRPQGNHDNMLNSQSSLGLDVDSLWGQPSTSSDLMWMQQSLPRSEARVNNLPMYFWDQQVSRRLLHRP